MIMRAKRRILLVGCGAKKAPLGTGEELPARDIYVGNLFIARRQYAESTGCPWWIASGLFGLVRPEQPLPTYNHPLEAMKAYPRQRWGLGLVTALSDAARALGFEPGNLVLELHAGEVYAAAIEQPAAAAGFELTRPLQGLGIGLQLRWYMQSTDTHAQ